jgi:uncharacterized protein (TIGR03435 family)
MNRSLSAWHGCFSVAIAALLISCIVCTSEQQAHAQTKKKLKFEVVSVKPSISGVLQFQPQRSGDRLQWQCVPLIKLIEYAYDIPIATIDGEVPLMMYDIDAKVPPSATERNIKEMFQSLLEDRFAFRTHKETREMPFLNLVISSGGHRLKPARDLQIPTIQGKPLPPNHVGEYSFSDGRHFAGAGVTLAQIAIALADVLKQPVFDKTGIKGTFNLDVLHAKEGAVGGGALLPIKTAIENNLGLRFEERVGPVEIMVIDHVEEPR